MTRHLIFILHLPGGIHTQTKPYKSYIGLQNAAQELIAEADMEPKERKAYASQATKMLTELALATRSSDLIAETNAKAKKKLPVETDGFVVRNASGTPASPMTIVALKNKLSDIRQEMHTMKQNGKVTGDPIYKELIKKRKALEAQLGLSK